MNAEMELKERIKEYDELIRKHEVLIEDLNANRKTHLTILEKQMEKKVQEKLGGD